MLKEKVVASFEAKFGQKPEFLVRAPGRVNLIGEHTDYNDGFVLPMAIDREVWIALRSRDDKQVNLHSIDYDATATFCTMTLKKDSDNWSEYLKGVAYVLKDFGVELNGFEGVVSGNVPHGAGLSSSAALELATACAFHAVSSFSWQPKQMALLAQKAENEWVGVNCGIMDQLISAVGEKDHAVLIDCRSLDTTSVALPTGTSVVVLDTATRRGLVDSAYNERRSQCEAAAAYFGVKALRDVSMEQLVSAKADLSEMTYKRALHVVTENDRTVKASEAMKANDGQAFGSLMNASHQSLRDDFEVSCDSLDIMVDIAQAQNGCLGARMTGAGFGGCAVALVKQEAAEVFAELVAATYEQKTGNTPSVYICSPSQGASLEAI